MSWANLAGLLWFLPLGALIVALYLLKMRRRDVKVPAKFLWPERVDEVRANSLFQKLKPSWLLFLQLLALLMIVLAFARPQFLERALGGSVTVLVLDSSASMQATDVAPTRMGAAIAQIDRLLANAKPGDRVALVEAGPTPRVLASLSDDPAKLRRALEKARPTDAEADVGEALRLAAGITRKERSARILLFSDGAFAPIEDFQPGTAELAFVQIGDSGRNVGIAGFGVTGGQAFVGIKNYGLDEATGTASLFADGKLIDSWAWKAGADQTVGRTIPRVKGQRFEAKLQTGDHLKADDQATALSDEGARIRALLVSKGNLFLERALSLDPRVELEKTTTVPTTGAWDLIVYDGIPEADLSARAVLTFGTPGPTSAVRRLGSVNEPSTGEVEGDPLTKGVNFRGVYIDSGTAVEPKSGAKTVAWMRGSGKNYPLVVTSRTGGVRRAFVAFEPLKSDFPLQVGFPVFVGNALNELLPPLSSLQDLPIVPGRTISLPATKSEPVTLKGPQGESVLTPNRGVFVIRDAVRVGTYTFGDRKLYASLRSPIESKIMPSDRLQVAGKAVEPAGNLARLSDLWVWIAILGLLVLGVEWWMFARRS